jgi:CsoR family transcriptional regulator, copper-sensing transcriptional repressor
LRQDRIDTVDYEVIDKRIFLRRTPEKKQPLLARLARVEGQVRGLRQMIEDDRYCGDELQQVSAITAALREVALLVLKDHLEVGVEYAAQVRNAGEGAEAADTAVSEMLTLMRSVLKQ